MTDYYPIIRANTKLLEQLLCCESYGFNSNLKKFLPALSGIYAIFNKESNVALYVGESKNIQKRVSEDLFQGNESRHTLKRKIMKDLSLETLSNAKDFLRKDCSVRFLQVEGLKRKAIEHFLISILKPRWND